MRSAFISMLMALARANKDLYVLTGDLGFSVFEEFQKAYPKRFFDVGVAEQNMMGIAAGLALSGKTVFVYSIIPFVTMRCFEQIRNDICLHQAEVKIVGMGAGLHYGPAGPSHHATEDIGIMKSLPGMTVISPATREDTRQAMQQAVKCKGPVYIRLAKTQMDFERKLAGQRFRIGKALIWEDGRDVTLISYGRILHKVAMMKDMLKKKGFSVRLINMHTLKPLDQKVIVDAARETSAIFTVDEHNISGGLGTGVAEVLAQCPDQVFFRPFGLPDGYIKTAGQSEYLQNKYGLNEDEMTKTILRDLNGVRRVAKV